MFAVGLIELLVVLLLVLGMLALMVVLVVRGRRHGAKPVTVTREWHLVRLTRVVGASVGVAAGWLVAERGSYGSGPLLAPAVFGLCVVAGVALGETLVRPRRTAGPRSASLSTRRVRDYLPRTTTVLVGVVLALEIGTLVLTTTTASRDGYTGSMRALACSGPGFSNAHTPYPGSYYSVPLAVILLAVLVVAGLAARQVVRRPRGMSTTDAGDDVLRRRSCRVVVASTGFAVCAPFSAVAVIAGGAMRSISSSCAPGWADPVGTVLLCSSLLAFVVGLWCAVQLITPAPRSAEVAVPEPVRR